MNPDQAIDRVLTALATTEAPPDMEQRVLNTLQSHAATRQEARIQRAPFALPSFFTPTSRHPERSEGSRGSSRRAYLSNLSATAFRPWAVAAGLIILSLAASLAVRRRHEPTQDVALKQGTPPQTAPAPQLAEAQLESRLRHTVISAWQRKTDAAAPEDINDLDAMAVIEMNAPSRPAPPLPLTRQEKLLATAVDHAGAEKLSTLRSEVMAQQMELSRAEFHNFFDPPPTKDNE
jgi:hypothetical protein